MTETTPLNAVAGDDSTALATMEGAVREANQLAEAALAIQRAGTETEMAAALRANLHLWVAIRADVKSPKCRMPAELRDRLLDLTAYVTQTIMATEDGPVTTEQLSSLMTINLRVATGLLEGQIKRLLGTVVFDAWVGAGAPTGADMETWLASRSAEAA